MTSISYINGRYIDHIHAMVHIDDRGFHFADGVFEVIQFKNKILLDGNPHFERLLYSLGELNIPPPMSIASLKIVIKELIRRNNLNSGSLYIQVTRGEYKRDHTIIEDSEPSIVLTISTEVKIPEDYYTKGVKASLIKDIRWSRRDIKSISLLANILLKDQAKKENSYEAVLYDEENNITEGSSSNIFIVGKDGKIYTHPPTEEILCGITRNTVISLAERNNIEIIEEPFAMKDLKTVKGMFLTSSLRNIIPITTLDKKKIGNGKVDEITKKLIILYNQYISSNQ